MVDKRENASFQGLILGLVSRGSATWPGSGVKPRRLPRFGPEPRVQEYDARRNLAGMPGGRALGGFIIIEGSCCAVLPAGTTNRADYEMIPDEILGQLSAAFNMTAS